MNKIYYIYITILVVVFTACEKVVDLDLKSAEPRLVIDGSIRADYPCVVRLSMTQAFGNNNPYKPVSGALVELFDENGTIEVLQESQKEKGLYKSFTVGVVNKQYNLRVIVDGNRYEASSTIPQAVPIDSLYIYNVQVGSEKWYSPAIIFNDPVEVENYYYTMVTINDKLLRTIYLDDDEYRNGVVGVDRVLFYDSSENNDKEIEIGDEVKVEMQMIDQGAYTFYKSLFSVAAGGATNPISNIKGGVLGVFKAYNSSSRTIVVSQKHIFTKN